MSRRRMSRGGRQLQTRQAGAGSSVCPRTRRLRVETLEERRLLSVVPAAEPSGWDFGDAPDVPYGTLLASDGPRHGATGPTLGAYRDAETDGQPTASADGDDNDVGTDDEDGVTFDSEIRVGQLDAVVTVDVQNAPDGAKLDAWIDFNGDGCWGGAGERIAASVEVVEGDNRISFDVPSYAVSGGTYARFRVSALGGLGPLGAAADGEVEDYRLTIASPRRADGEFVWKHVIADDCNHAEEVFSVDLDGDGDMDVLSASLRDDKIAWYENDGEANFTAHIITTSADGAVSIFAADVDGDGDLDVLSASAWDDEIAWYENDGEESFAAHAITTSADGAVSVFAADVDGDGDLDVLSGSCYDDKIAWYENDGEESFAAHAIATSVDGAVSLLAADMDGDGDLDVLSASCDNDEIAWYENDGEEDFTVHSIAGSTDEAVSVFAADVDGDGDMDVLSASYDNDEIAWYENDGEEDFTAHLITGSANGASSVFAADIDGDGDMDVVSASCHDDRIAWYENNGDENFTVRTITTSANYPVSVFVADVDGDGDLDVLSASAYDDTIAWYEQVSHGEFGDAPAPYPTLLTDNGAVHQTYGPRLGIERDGELNGQPTDAADGDDLNHTDDEDGITSDSWFIAGREASVTVNVQDAPAGAKLDAWIDFNADGDWDDSGERIADSLLVSEGDNTITFDVPAGIANGTSYARFRLSTAGGLSPTGPAEDGEVEDYLVELGPVDLGPVGFLDVPGLDPSAGELWYRFETTRAGFATVHAVYDPAGGDLAFELFDAEYVSLGLSDSGNGDEGIDHMAGAAGEVYLIKLSGANPDVQLLICNLVSQDGREVHVSGTADNDFFAFNADGLFGLLDVGIHHLLSINGVIYRFADAELPEAEDFAFTFHGGPGDVALLNGSPGDDEARLYPTSGWLGGEGYRVNVLDTAAIAVQGDGGIDTVSFYDSAGDDTYTAWPQYANMVGPGYAHEAYDFYYSHAYAKTPGEDHDRAVFYDSADNDTFKLCWPLTGRAGRQIVKMYRFGYYNRSKMFESNVGHLSGGDDLVRLFDSAGDDVLEAWHGFARMSSADYEVIVDGAFQTLLAYADEGHDKAYLFDSVADDVIRARRNKSVMWSGPYSDPDYMIIERRFDEVYAWAESDLGFDKAKLHAWGPDDLIFEGSNWKRVEYARVNRSVEVIDFEWFKFFDLQGQTPVTSSEPSTGVIITDIGCGAVNPFPNGFPGLIEQVGTIDFNDFELVTTETVDLLMAEEGSGE